MSDLHSEVEWLQQFIVKQAPICVITGAGCSTPSGIFDYRDQSGAWKRQPPVQLSHFLKSSKARRTYWARSMLGWGAFHLAKPTIIHTVLRELERRGVVDCTITQNVDNLHQQAQQQKLIPLHGSLASVSCIDCTRTVDRQAIQRLLEQNNPIYVKHATRSDAGGEGRYDVPVDDSFWIPTCTQCGGILKPDVVFFGANLDPKVKEDASTAVDACQGLWVIGSSLMVYSAYRLVRQAHENGKPIACVNLGSTRADSMFSGKIVREVTQVFEQLAAVLEV